MIGSGSMALLGVFVAMVALSIVAHQRFAPWIAIGGLATLAWLALSIAMQIDFPYRTFNISIYLVLFAGVLLTAAGVVGIVVKMIRKKT